MKYRHELKHVVNRFEVLELRPRLRAVMSVDSHAAGGSYSVRSLYFDDLHDSALREKLDGVNRREKFRIRFYNGDTSFIVLEKKCKEGGLCSKQQTRLTPEEAEATVSIGSEDAVLLFASVAVLATGITVALVYRKRR